MDFKNLQPNIANAIKESCPKQDEVIYRISDEVDHIKALTVEPGVEIAQGLSMIIDATIKRAADSGCDAGVIVKGLLIGAFRSSPFIVQEAHKTIRILIKEILQAIVKYKGDVNQAREALLAAIVIIAKEFKLNEQEAMIVAGEDIKEALSNPHD